MKCACCRIWEEEQKEDLKKKRRSEKKSSGIVADNMKGIKKIGGIFCRIWSLTYIYISCMHSHYFM